MLLRATFLIEISVDSLFTMSINVPISQMG